MVNLFLVGAAKCGTTSFHSYLAQHPNICMSKVKEVNYFTHEEIKEDGLYYRGNTLISDSKAYENQFESKDYKYLGESSVSYLFYPNTAQKLFEYNPDAKILIFLRNPIDRAFSHFLMDYNAGYINSDFESIVNKLCTKQEYQQVIQLGLYYNQVKRYIDLFGKNVSVHIFEEWIGKEYQGLRAIEEFLGVPNFNKYNFEKENSYFEPNNKYLKSFNRSVLLKSFIKCFLSKENISKLKQSITKENTKPSLHVDIRKKLSGYYIDDIQNLSLLISKNLKTIWCGN